MATSEKLRILAPVLALLIAAGVGPLWTGQAAAQEGPVCQGKTATLVHVGYEGEVVGTEDDDVIYVEGGWNTIYGGSGDDTICSAGHFNTLYGGDGDDELVGDGLHNVLYGEEGDDTLIADDNDALLGGDGSNVCNGVGC